MQEPEPPFTLDEPVELAPGERTPHRRAPRSGRRRALRWALRLLVVAVVFLAGLVVGKALEDAPKPGGAQTIVNTLRVPTEAPLTGSGP